MSTWRRVRDWIGIGWQPSPPPECDLLPTFAHVAAELRRYHASMALRLDVVDRELAMARRSHVEARQQCSDMAKSIIDRIAGAEGVLTEHVSDRIRIVTGTKLSLGDRAAGTAIGCDCGHLSATSAGSPQTGMTQCIECYARRHPGWRADPDVEGLHGA